MPLLQYENIKLAILLKLNLFGKFVICFYFYTLNVYQM